MESIICVDIPVQMISCTDTNGKITPMRFRFRDKNGKIITVEVEKILSEDQDQNRVGANFTCSAPSMAHRKPLTSDTITKRGGYTTSLPMSGTYQGCMFDSSYPRNSSPSMSTICSMVRAVPSSIIT